MSSAATALQVVAATSVTVTTLTFSLTVVTLQLASQQFSPRLLRRYGRDRATKTVLTVLTVTFVFILTTLSFLDEPVPALAVFLGTVLGLASVAAALGYLTQAGGGGAAARSRRPTECPLRGSGRHGCACSDRVATERQWCAATAGSGGDGNSGVGGFAARIRTDA